MWHFFLHSKAETIINEGNTSDVFKSIYTTVILKIQIFLGKSSGWILDLVIDHTVSISKYNPLAGGNYMKLSKKNRTSK